MTVSGLTMIRAERQSGQIAARHAQKHRSEAISFGRLTELENVELVAKSKDLNLKGCTAAKAIARSSENGPKAEDTVRKRRRLKS